MKNDENIELSSPSIDTPLLEIMGRRKLCDTGHYNRMSASKIAEIVNASEDSFDLLKDSEDSMDVPLRHRREPENKTPRAVMNDDEEQGGLKPMKELSLSKTPTG